MAGKKRKFKRFFFFFQREERKIEGNGVKQIVNQNNEIILGNE